MSLQRTIDVRCIPGPQRHPLIFQTFETLHPGEALELLNDHDPFPLHDQFNFIKRRQFSWESLQQGPDLCQVRIGKVERQSPAISGQPRYYQRKWAICSGKPAQERKNDDEAPQKPGPSPEKSTSAGVTNTAAVRQRPRAN